MNDQKQGLRPWRHNLHEIIYEADNPAGKLFDVTLLIIIAISIATAFLESVDAFKKNYYDQLFIAEWVITVLFTIEYFLRIVSIRQPLKYIFSFYGIVDLVALLPTYLGIFVEGTQALMVIRVLRLLRVFRVFKLGRFLGEGAGLLKALKASRFKIIVFLGGVLSIVCVLGSIMYIVEGTVKNTQFSSIPMSAYWAIVTLTTVGYGDISPQTDLGRAISSIVMLLGYAILAVPTGIVSVEMAKVGSISTQSCPSCGAESHDEDAKHCKYCGAKL